jgi:hypothetical protein
MSQLSPRDTEKIYENVQAGQLANLGDPKRVSNNNKLRGLSPQAHYTDRATAACQRSFKLLRIEGVAWSAQRIPTAVNLGFLDRSRTFPFK